jgi:general secretion pathway protein G
VIGKKRLRGFTLIELLVVMAIIATLASIAAPRYFKSLENSREVALRANLKAMREAIDQFYQDTGKWPASLDDLVKNRYLREIPVDPVVGDATSWAPVKQTGTTGAGIRDIRSGAAGTPRDGTRYEDW